MDPIQAVQLFIRVVDLGSFSKGAVECGRRVLVPLVMGFMLLHPKLQIDLSFEDRYVTAAR
jgi:DNA-binding transcriptional LysR family regulator